jgi:hypothetical protein
MFCSVVRSTELFITNQTKVAWGLVNSRFVTFSVVVSRERFAALLDCTAEDPDKISISRVSGPVYLRTADLYERRRPRLSSDPGCCYAYTIKRVRPHFRLLKI